MNELGQNSFTRLFVLEATFTSFYKERHALLLCMSLFTYIIYHVSVDMSIISALLTRKLVNKLCWCSKPFFCISKAGWKASNLLLSCLAALIIHKWKLHSRNGSHYFGFIIFSVDK